MNRDQKIKNILDGENVTLYSFLPTGREIWTVKTPNGLHVVIENRLYCTCGHFYFSVLSGKDDTCYHIDIIRIAKTTKKHNTVENSDADFGKFMRTTLSELTL